MAVFLIESLVRNNSKTQIAIWAIELVFLFAGVISTMFVVKDYAVFPCSFDVVLSSFMSVKSWLSSTLYIGIVINFMVVLIAALSFYHKQQHNNSVERHSTHQQGVDEDDDLLGLKHDDHEGGVLKAVLLPSSPPLPSAPPLPLPSAPPLPLPSAPPLPSPRQESQATLVIEATAALAREATRLRNTISASVAFFENYLSHHIWHDTEHQKLVKNTEDSLLALFNASSLTEEAIEQIKEDSIDNSLPQFTREEAYLPEKELQLTNEYHQEEKFFANNEENDDSMEAMWKAITEGTEQPINNQLKKSETYPTYPENNQATTSMSSVQSIDSRGLLPSAAAAWRELRKSVTFDDAISMRKRAGLMRDSSMSLDSLNKRVETFINKFNKNMRIERQESEQRYLNKVRKH